MKRTLLLLLVLGVGSVLAALAVGEVLAPKAVSTVYVKTATGHVLPKAASVAKPGDVKRFAQAYLKGPGTATVRLVLPDGTTRDLLTFSLPASGLTPVQASIRVGPAVDAAKLLANINPEDLANE